MKLPWNFSRPGSGWVMDRSGIYVERGVDEPRYQWTPDGRSEGLLIERQATNGFPNTDLTAPSGTFFPYGSLSLHPTEKFGSHSYLVEGDGVSSQVGFRRTAFIDTPVEGEVRYLPVKAREISFIRVTGYGFETTTSIDFNLLTGEVSELSSGNRYDGIPPVELGNGWWLAGIRTGSEVNSAYRHFGVRGMDALGGAPVNAAGAGFYVALPQYRANGAIDSLIPTTGTPITRPADTIYADMSLVPEFDPTKGTIVVEWVDYSAASGYFPIFLSSSDTFSTTVDHVRIDRVSTGASIRIVIRADGAGAIGNPPIPTVHGEVTRAAFRYDGATVALSANGSNVTHGTHSENKSPVGLRYLHVGRGCHGLYRSVKYIPHAVSDVELQQLSSLNP